MPQALDDTGEFDTLSELAEPTDVTLEAVEGGGDSEAGRPSSVDTVAAVEARDEAETDEPATCRRPMTPTTT